MLSKDITIKTIEHPMGDGSSVYNVLVIDERQNAVVIDFPAYTEKSASDFSEGLMDLIEKHTLSSARLA